MKEYIGNSKEEKVTVCTGVDIRKDGAKPSGNRMLKNAIKITAEGKSVHFIQFITRQTPKRTKFGCDIFLHCDGSAPSINPLSIIFVPQGKEVGCIFIDKRGEIENIDTSLLDGKIMSPLKDILMKQKGFKDAYQIPPLKIYLAGVVKVVTKGKQLPEPNSTWDPVDRSYMTCMSRPKWKLDVVDSSFINPEKWSKTIYYEEKGVNKKSGQFVSMYDEPGGISEPYEERSVFCTFVIVDNRVVCLVKWSKQRDAKEKEFYTVKICYQSYLSHWAVKLLKEKYPKLLKKTPEYVELLKKQPEIDENNFDFEKEESKDFLKWPETWMTCTSFPLLFLQQTANTLEKEEEEDRGEEKVLEL